MISFKMNMPFHLIAFYGSIMIAAVLVLHGLLKNRLPKFVFPALWGVVLLRLLIPFSLSSPLSMKVPEFALSFPYTEREAATVEVSLVEDPPILQHGISSVQNENIVTTAMPETITQEAISQEPHTSYFIDARTILLLYLAGALVTAGILLAQKYSYSRRLKNALLIEHNETINTLLREMDMGHILVFTNDEIASPLVCGLLAPRIYLPTRMDFGSTELLRHILSHETMHIRRKDNWLKTVMLVALCIHWFNPLVWILSRYLASDLEMACDEAVLRRYDHGDEAEENKKNYAMSLLAMAVSGSRQTLLYSAFSKTEVEKRIQNVLHYRKASALLLALSVCLLVSGSVVLATGGQAPFYQTLTPYCASDSCRWGVQVDLTRDIALGRDAEVRASERIFDIMRTDAANDPDILKAQILAALSDEFHVEKSAFSLHISLCLDDEILYEEYARWGLVRSSEDNLMSLLYNGETVRSYSDKMIGRYMSQPEGAVDLTVERDRLGEIVAVSVSRKGDPEYDRRTAELEQSNRKYASDFHSADIMPGIESVETSVQVQESH